MKYSWEKSVVQPKVSLPTRERGLKYDTDGILKRGGKSLPTRERELKYDSLNVLYILSLNDLFTRLAPVRKIAGTGIEHMIARA